MLSTILSPIDWLASCTTFRMRENVVFAMICSICHMRWNIHTSLWSRNSGRRILDSLKSRKSNHFLTVQTSIRTLALWQNIRLTINAKPLKISDISELTYKQFIPRFHSWLLNDSLNCRISLKQCAKRWYTAKGGFQNHFAIITRVFTMQKRLLLVLKVSKDFLSLF